jgi:hypothetical protein
MAAITATSMSLSVVFFRGMKSCQADGKLGLGRVAAVPQLRDCHHLNLYGQRWQRQAASTDFFISELD